MSEPRAYTTEEVRDLLLDRIRADVRYWRDLPDKTTAERLDGLAFSILATLDGCSMWMPAFLVTPMPHDDDREFCIAQGKNWFPTDEPDLGMLHEFWHKNEATK